MSVLKFRAWYGGDIELGKPRKFIQDIRIGTPYFTMEDDYEIGYEFGAYWLIETPKT